MCRTPGTMCKHKVLMIHTIVFAIVVRGGGRVLKGLKHPGLYSRVVARIWEGGQEFFFRFRNLHVAKRHAANSKAMRFAMGVRGHVPQEKILKWCNLVRFSVCLDQILSLKIFKNYHFYIKTSKIIIFYIN